jgi:hypothetical protein
MHEDSTAILRCYTEEAVARSREGEPQACKNIRGKQRAKEGVSEEKKDDVAAGSNSHMQLEEGTKRAKVLLADASDDELIKELARRKAEQFRLSGSMKRLEVGDDDAALPEDGTGQVCSLNGGDGSIPCRELME